MYVSRARREMSVLSERVCALAFARSLVDAPRERLWRRR